jgi:hypothetical protein
MNDLTILYITANEMPNSWTSFQLGHLLKAIGETLIISVSRKPMTLGWNLLDTSPKSYWNIYAQMLRACKFAKTEFVAMAEDDVLYTPEHFEFRPPSDAVSYNRSRWSLFSWEENPIYCLRQRISNCSLIAPRELLIQALEERQTKYPQGLPNEMTGEVGREKIEKRMGVTIHKCVEWWGKNPIVQLNHLTGTDVGEYGKDKTGRRLVKPHGQIQAIEIPYFGRASEIVEHYHADRDRQDHPTTICF